MKFSSLHFTASLLKVCARCTSQGRSLLQISITCANYASVFLLGDFSHTVGHSHRSPTDLHMRLPWVGSVQAPYELGLHWRARVLVPEDYTIGLIAVPAGDKLPQRLRSAELMYIQMLYTPSYHTSALAPAVVLVSRNHRHRLRCLLYFSED